MWDDACTYDWDGLLKPEEAEAEREQIAQSRAALPETTFAEETTAAETETVGETQESSSGGQETEAAE